MPQVSSPMIAMKAGNRSQMALAKNQDPIRLAQIRWNNDLVLAGGSPSGSEAPRDGAPYTVPGAPQPFCWPKLKVSWRVGFQPGPEVRFQNRDDGMHLTVVFEEDPQQRVPGTLPFDVKITSVRLEFGPDASDFLDFPEPMPRPMDVTKGPAFAIEADALVPLDERRARLVAALQTRATARWVVKMQFEWTQTITIPPPPPPTRPPGRRPRPRPRPRPGTFVPRPQPGLRPRSELLVSQPDMWRVILATEVTLPQVRTEVKTIEFVRTINAEYPKDSPENRPIFAAVTGDYAQAGWRNTAHGWFQPTPIQDTVYCLPHSYRLQVDETTGLPSIQAVLLRKADAASIIDPLDPKNYSVRLSLKVRPDFDTEQLNALRDLIRAQSSDTVRFADLVLGGYSGARFVPDPSLAGLGELFAGSTAGARDTINPETGFTITYEGNAEFIDLLFQRLKGEGIDGNVEIDLQEPGGAIRKQPVPVVLTLRKLAAISLPLTFSAPAAPAAAPADALPTNLELKNPMGVEVTLDGIQAYALQKSPVTGHVEKFYRAKPDGTWPRSLPAGSATSVQLGFSEDTPIFNAWDVSLVDCYAAISTDLVLSQLFDAATSGVRGWRVSIDCPPLQFFDQLTPEDKAKMSDVAAIEVEVRRKDSLSIEEVRLTRQAPSGTVLLSRTVADFVADRSSGRSTFEYRKRVLRLTRADDWSPWSEETGSALSVFLT